MIEYLQNGDSFHDQPDLQDKLDVQLLTAEVEQ